MSAIRTTLVEALRADLVGPYQADELLELAPSRWYLSGFLAPETGREPEEESNYEEDDDVGGVPSEPTEETPAGESSRRPSFLPASLGLSFFVPGSSSLEVDLQWADYHRVEHPRQQNGEQGPKEGWARSSAKRTVVVALDALASGLAVPESGGLVLTGVVTEAPSEANLGAGARAVSLFLVNRRRPADLPPLDGSFVFQVELEVRSNAGFLPRPNLRDEHLEDPDAHIADLQYRDVLTYSIGHNVATLDPTPSEVVSGRGIRTTWLPQAAVLRVETRAQLGIETRLDTLASLESAAAVRLALDGLPEGYRAWIELQAQADLGKSAHAARRSQVSQELQDRMRSAAKRIESGIARLCADSMALEAFRIANRAVADALGRPPRSVKAPTWRLFQLGFILMNVDGAMDGSHVDRETVDLIFFPTGGGKTEAYLGVIAFVLVLRRLRALQDKADHEGLGVGILLRYTLRLLTLDQLGRAASLVCALEVMRRKAPERLGATRFSIGLWVGKSASPNKVKHAIELLTAYRAKRGPSPCPIERCPWCGELLTPNSFQSSVEEILVGCVKCEFSRANNPEGLPILFVDEQIYRELPSFVIATVDKLAQLPRRMEAGMLFGRGVQGRLGRRCFSPEEKLPKGVLSLKAGLLPPDLIVQDEVHLIAGPLGTMVGLFETAVEVLSTGAQKPKLIASTATLRRADQHIRALFARSQVSVFPPQGIDEGETWFGRVDREHPGRWYVGVCAAGRQMRGVLLRVTLSLLAAAAREYERAPDDADAFMTLVAYFNTLRDLGGTRRLIEDDVRTRLAKISERLPLNAVGPHRWYSNRELGDVVELTSRESTSNITKFKDRLSSVRAQGNPIDVAVATNMISVGVDIDRLGLMVVSGQPKTTAEYIQATSRVGRNVNHPGLVVTCLNAHRPRDRSHYEQFTAYHESFYRFVEATSLTPFSLPAMERGLAAVIVALARHATPELMTPRGLTQILNHPEVRQMVESVVPARARAVHSFSSVEEQNEIVNRIKNRCATLMDAWMAVAGTVLETHAANEWCYSAWESTGRALLFDANDDREDKSSDELRFQVPSSMRDVEPSVHLWLSRSSHK